MVFPKNKIKRQELRKEK